MIQFIISIVVLIYGVSSLIAFFTSIDIIRYPLFSTKAKFVRIMLTWAIPFHGSFRVQKEMGQDQCGGSSGGGDHYSSGDLGGGDGGT